MKRSIYLLSFIFAGLILAGCSNQPTALVDRIELGESFTLAEGQSAVIASEGLEIAFIRVSSDGRCPTGMACFWEGLAEIEIGVRLPGRKGIIVTPGISGSGNGIDYRASAYDYTIIINALEPYPENVMILMPILAQSYRATLTVENRFHYPSTVTPVIISDSPPDSIQLDAFDLIDMEITADTLAVTVAYGGGCKKHYFWLYMSPSVFMESEPVQASLFLRHESNDDMCEAYITDTRKFDLTPIKELYQQMYGPHGSIRLNLYEYFIDQPGDFMDVIYSF